MRNADANAATDANRSPLARDIARASTASTSADTPVGGALPSSTRAIAAAMPSPSAANGFTPVSSSCAMTASAH